MSRGSGLFLDRDEVRNVSGGGMTSTHYGATRPSQKAPPRNVRYSLLPGFRRKRSVRALFFSNLVLRWRRFSDAPPRPRAILSPGLLPRGCCLGSRSEHPRLPPTIHREPPTARE